MFTVDHTKDSEERKLPAAMVQDTNGIDITQQPDKTGSNTPQHASELHKGYFLNDKAKVSEIDGSEL